jgi:hypothetical protein
MPSEFDISKARRGDLDNVLTDFEVAARDTDAAQNQPETEWMNTDWAQWHGYYKEIPEFKKAIDMKAIWTVGKGFKADSLTTIVLENITGWGIDTFNSILKNMIITRQVGGDAFAEIIRRKEDGTLLNLKPLDPGSIRIIVNRKGIIKRYEQINKIAQKNVVINKFEPHEILHLTRDRIADEIHGVSVTESVQWIIDARHEAMRDMKKFMHRFVKPMMKFVLNTDNKTKIDAFVNKYDLTVEKGDNLYVPKNTVEHEIISVPTNATLNPLPWIDYLNNAFFQAVGIPQVVVGGSPHITESASKITYLSFQQTIEDEQQDIEDQIWNQLALRIELDFPASLQNELLSDEKKDVQQGAVQANDTIAGRGE